MGLKDNAKALIDANVYANGQEQITGQGLNATLKGMVDILPTTDEILTGINGAATESNAPNMGTGFFRYIVTEPITTGSAWGIEVTQAELDDNWVFFNVTDGVITKDSKPQQGGKSAYELAVEAGFSGTEAEWLESLNGADGADGKTTEQWSAKAFVAGDTVYHNNKIWRAEIATTSADEPGLSDKWVVVFQNSIEGQITPEQTTFFDNIPSKNLFDKSKVQAGYYDLVNGYSFLPAADLHSSPEFIKVEPNTQYSSTNPFAYILFYRADKSYPVGQPAASRYKSTGAGATTFTTPSDIEYVRILVQPVSVNTMQFEKGLPTPYEPFGGTTTLKPEYIPTVEMGTHYIQVVKDGTGDFTTIKAAGLASSPKDLIVVHEGEYEEVCNFGAKEVHIMALCKETTILWNDSGKYADTPLYMGKGSVKNLQIKSIRSPLKDYSAIGATGYAVHYDTYNENARMLFENVDAISDFNSAFGCGLKANSHLIIRNCRAIATGLHGETGGVAGFACHGGPAGITARIVLDKSEFRGPLMDIYLSYSANAQTINLEAYYNIAKIILINSPEIWVKNPYNFGNQAPALNTL